MEPMKLVNNIIRYACLRQSIGYYTNDLSYKYSEFVLKKAKLTIIQRFYLLVIIKEQAYGVG